MTAEEIYYFLKPFCELGTVSGRTRVQKLFYLLRGIGYPLRLDYFLHYYGPYSETITALLAQAQQNGLLQETCEEVGPDAVRCDYAPTENGRRLVASIEEEDHLRSRARERGGFVEDGS